MLKIKTLTTKQKNIIDAIENQKSLSQRQKIILEILSIYNCRISEILSATLDNYFPGRFLILKGKKRSADIVITDRQILQSIDNLRIFSSNKIFDGVSYIQIYRIVKLNYSHLFRKFKKRKNDKVTHGFRYLNILNIKDIDSIKTILHHNSKKSQEYYKL